MVIRQQPASTSDTAPVYDELAEIRAYILVQEQADGTMRATSEPVQVLVLTPLK